MERLAEKRHLALINVNQLIWNLIRTIPLYWNVPDAACVLLRQ